MVDPNETRPGTSPNPAGLEHSRRPPDLVPVTGDTADPFTTIPSVAAPDSAQTDEPTAEPDGSTVQAQRPGSASQADETGEHFAPTNDPDGTITAPPAGDPGATTAGTRAPSPKLGGGPVPGYEITSELGRGGMGVVYRAVDLKLNRVVALKVVLAGSSADDGDRERFLEEARAVALIQHPNVVQVFEVDEAGGVPFCALEFAPGGTLSGVLKHEPQAPALAAKWSLVLARAMEAVHAVGLVHRDLKPANVLVAADGTLKITDFGLAKRLDDPTGKTQAGRVMGTPSYMAPEQAVGDINKIGPVTDVWALGAILYEMLTGRVPFKGTGVWDTIAMVLTDDPVPVRQLQPGCPRDLETVCLKCLAKDPQRRYPSAAALADDLARFLDGRPVLARRAGPVERAVRWAKRSPFQAATVAAAVLLVGAVMAALALQARADRLQSQSDRVQAQSDRAEAEVQRREVAELRRRDEVTARVTSLYRKAEESAAEAATVPREAPRSRDLWTAVERDTSSALGLLAAEEALSEFPLRDPTTALLTRARAQLSDAQGWSEGRARFGKFRDLHGEAVFFGSDFTGLEVPDNAARTRRTVADALALFGVVEGSSGPPVADPRYFAPEEARLIADRCYELLLLDAGALARPIPGEQAKAWHARVREALARLDRADKLLGAGGAPRCGLLKRAELATILGDAPGAEAAKKLAEATAPRLAADYFAEALALYRGDEYARAVDPLAAVLRENPDHYGAEYLLAVCRVRDRQYQTAREGLTRCLERQPGFPWPRLLRGYAAMELRRWDEARADFEAVLTNPPDPVAGYVARVNRGVLAMREREWAKAETDFRAATKELPRAPAAYLNLALALDQHAADEVQTQSPALAGAGGPGVALVAARSRREAGRRAAARVLDDAVANCPADARLHHERAQFHLILGDSAGAREDFKRAVALAATRGAGGTLADDLIELGRLYHQNKQYEEAVRAYQAALSVRPDRAIALRLQAQPLIALNRRKEALASLERYIQTVPVSPGQAPTAAQAADLADALRTQGQVRVDEARAFRASGLLSTSEANARAALDAYTRGLTLVRDPETLTLRGWTYMATNAPELALADFDEAIRLRPDSGEAFLGRASARIRAGDIAQAIADAEAGARLAPDDIKVCYHAARVHAQAVPLTPNPAAVTESLRRATELLGRAAELTAPADRGRFWAEHVTGDRAFDPLRRTGRLDALDAAYAQPKR